MLEEGLGDLVLREALQVPGDYSGAAVWFDHVESTEAIDRQ